jgi:hypothetical protein
MAFLETVRKLGREAERALSPQAPDDILDTLKREHDDVKTLLGKLQDAEKATERRSLVRQIAMALVPHTKAEQKIVYDAVLALRDPKAKIHGEEGYLEHEWASKTLDRLMKMTNAASPEHKAAGKVLKELVEHHIGEEESAIWSDVENNFSNEQRRKMNKLFLAAKKRVRV